MFWGIFAEQDPRLRRSIAHGSRSITRRSMFRQNLCRSVIYGSRSIARRSILRQNICRSVAHGSRPIARRSESRQNLSQSVARGNQSFAREGASSGRTYTDRSRMVADRSREGASSGTSNLAQIKRRSFAPFSRTFARVWRKAYFSPIFGRNRILFLFFGGNEFSITVFILPTKAETKNPFLPYCQDCIHTHTHT